MCQHVFRLWLSSREKKWLHSYFVVQINKKLNWTHSTDALFKKGQSRLFCRASDHSVCAAGYWRFFSQSVGDSALFFVVICWGAGITTSRLNKLVRKGNYMAWLKLDSLELVVERRMEAKINSYPRFTPPTLPVMTCGRCGAHSAADTLMLNFCALPSDCTTAVETTDSDQLTMPPSQSMNSYKTHTHIYTIVRDTQDSHITPPLQLSCH